MNVRTATIKDFKKLYSLGSRIPELKVDKHEPFMTKEEFKSAIKNPYGVFLLAEEDRKILGFAYANMKDERMYKTACLVYLAVHPEYRHRGIGSLLSKERLKRLKRLGVKLVYSWIGANNKRMQKFAREQGFKRGKEFFWFDKKL